MGGGNYADYIKQCAYDGRSSEETVFKDSVDLDCECYYKNGVCVCRVYKNQISGKVEAVKFYSPHYKLPLHIAYVDIHEDVYKVRYFQPGTDSITSDVYLKYNLQPYLTKEYTIYNDAPKADKILLFPADDRDDIQIFSEENALVQYWLHQILKDGDVVVSDARVADAPLAALEKNIKIIFLMHNTHLRSDNGRLKRSFKRMFAHTIEKNALIVSLTNAQREDILQGHPKLKNSICVIPHAIDEKVVEFKVINKQICMVCRIEERQKNIFDAVKAFKLFISHPEGKAYKFLIYGDGKDKDQLAKFIEDNGLNKSVILKGHTTNPGKVFQESEFSLISSHYEGFSLSCLESVANGCPVVSYHVNYGPPDIVAEPIAGRIAKQNTPESLCEAMLAEVKSPRNREEVKARALEYSEEKFFERWSAIANLQAIKEFEMAAQIAAKKKKDARKRKKLVAEIQAIEQSLSWRITKPLRKKFGPIDYMQLPLRKLREIKRQFESSRSWKITRPLRWIMGDTF